MSSSSCERDVRGRFVKGWKGGPGRPKGTYTWLSGDEFKERYGFLNIVVPSPCTECGGIGFRFNLRLGGKNSYIVRCKCNHCNAEGSYRPYRDSWTSI